MGIGPAVDGLTVDVLHHQIRPPVFAGAGVEEAGDGGVIEAFEDLALAFEAAQQDLRVEAAPQDLDRHPSAVRVVAVRRQVDLAHAALAEIVEDLVGADEAGRLPVTEGPAGEVDHRLVDPAGEGLVVDLEEGDHFGAQRGVGAADPVEPVGALGLRQLQGFEQDLVDPAPAFGGGWVRPPSGSCPITGPGIRPWRSESSRAAVAHVVGHSAAALRRGCGSKATDRS